MTSQMTLPKLLAEKYASTPNKVALRQKDLGIWNELTWKDYYHEVEKMAIALAKQFNVQKGDRVALIGENRPQWLITEMATQALGAISVGIYQESLPSQISYYLNDTQARVVVVEDQEQVDKLLEIEGEIPFVEHIVYYNPQGMRHYQHPKLVFWEDAMKKAEALLKNEQGFLHKAIDGITSEDIAIIAYSAGATGDPKGIMLTHKNLIKAAQNLLEVDPVTEKDDYLSFLPLAWIHEQVMTVVIPLHAGNIVNFPERPSTVLNDLREIGPHTMLAPPRVFQTLMSNITSRMSTASRLKKFLYNTFKKYGDEYAVAALNGEKLSGWKWFMNTLGDFLIFSAIRDHFGLARLKRVYIAGATLNKEAFHFFHSLGVNLKQTYGGTELTGIAFVHRDNEIIYESSGKPLPGTEVKIGENGEIFIKNEQAFARYLHDEHQAEVEDGWFSLGDCGYIADNGDLVILDRIENVIVTQQGDEVYPSKVENKLKVSPYIQEAIVFGHDRPYLTAILNIDRTNVGRWADDHGVGYTTYAELAQRKKVMELIESEVNRLMQKLPKKYHVKKFVILTKPFTADDGELTRTLKVRRKFIADKYKQLIDEMYSDAREIEIEITNGKDAQKQKLKVLEVTVKAKEVA